MLVLIMCLTVFIPHDKLGYREVKSSLNITCGAKRFPVTPSFHYYNRVI